jgi:hypothetical protein
MLVVPWVIDQGADFPWGPVLWSTGAPLTPVNLTGCTATCIIRQLPTDPTTLVSISTTPNSEGSIQLVNPANSGVSYPCAVQVNIYNAVTSTLPVGSLGGATSVETLWLQWKLMIQFPANSQFPAGQNWPWGRGKVTVRA